ncbi:MAG: hypothetical protein HN542_10345 [Flavobacteriales bacterium]|jgi:hypothetical protein|nr:hypothetical protein [Flavobacteriales bacterium]NCG30329.1 hypothetical protein [Bacteroidota bacterium]MBT3964511.1 hypothetical protein [Flavobacteriales bacterium]MBT4705764.1 hypothetical protein [Flavobacteriales bacterium]MBT4930239.1 hypothetical protein [Flavobacteriales bacterium]
MDELKMKFNRLWAGIVLGLIGPWFGFGIFYLIVYNHRPFESFVRMILNNSGTYSSVISVSILFNLIFFYLALRLEWYYMVRGIIMATLIYAPIIVYFRYVA